MVTSADVCSRDSSTIRVPRFPLCGAAPLGVAGTGSAGESMPEQDKADREREGERERDKERDKERGRERERERAVLSVPPSILLQGLELDYHTYILYVQLCTCCVHTASFTRARTQFSLRVSVLRVVCRSFSLITSLSSSLIFVEKIHK